MPDISGMSAVGDHTVTDSTVAPNTNYTYTINYTQGGNACSRQSATKTLRGNTYTMSCVEQPGTITVNWDGTLTRPHDLQVYEKPVAGAGSDTYTSVSSQTNIAAGSPNSGTVDRPHPVSNSSYDYHIIVTYRDGA